MRKMEARGICGGGGGGGAQARSFDEGPTHTLFLFCISPQVDEEGGGGDEKEANEEEEEERKVSHSPPQFPLSHGASSFERERKVRRRFPALLQSPSLLSAIHQSASPPPPPSFFCLSAPRTPSSGAEGRPVFFGGGERTRPRSLWGKGVCVVPKIHSPNTFVGFGGREGRMRRDMSLSFIFPRLSWREA